MLQASFLSIISWSAEERRTLQDQLEEAHLKSANKMHEGQNLPQSPWQVLGQFYPRRKHSQLNRNLDTRVLYHANANKETIACRDHPIWTKKAYIKACTFHNSSTW